MLDALARTHPLPEGWSRPDVVVDAICADGVWLHRAGVSSLGPLGEVVGSAASPAASPIDRAYFELLERVCVAEAIRGAPSEWEALTLARGGAGRRSATQLFPESPSPDRYRYARSSGVALHVDWETAASRAFWELCERDRVLRSWCGGPRPVALPEVVESSPLAAARSFQWLACSFPAGVASRFSAGVLVCGVFGLPRERGPLVMGFGARPSEPHALQAAVSEAMQSLAFLWGEDFPESEPALSPTPMYHLLLFQRPERQASVRAWLEGAHVRDPGPEPALETDASTVFVDLTPPWLHGLSVAKAVCPAAVPLVFGEAPSCAHLPPALRVHPIP